MSNLEVSNTTETLVNNFMEAYKAKVEATSLSEANRYADEYLAQVSRGMSQEEAEVFVAAARKPLSAYLNSCSKEAEETVQELVDPVEASETEVTEEV